jgi:hypothetical protein
MKKVKLRKFNLPRVTNVVGRVPYVSTAFAFTQPKSYLFYGMITSYWVEIPCFILLRSPPQHIVGG